MFLLYIEHAFLPLMNHSFIRFILIVSGRHEEKAINDTSCVPLYNVRFNFTCVSEDQEEYDDVKNSNEDERNLMGRLL